MPEGQVRGSERSELLLLLAKSGPSSAFGTFSPRAGRRGKKNLSPRAGRRRKKNPSPRAGRGSSNKLNQRFIRFTVPPRAIGYSIGSVTTSPTRRAA
jgi:hypothetical protein